MPNTLPPLTWFRAFDAAARHLNFTAAAQELSLTQSAISQHVRSLELRLGHALFVRRPRGLALTDAGRQLVPDVSEAIRTLAQATDRLAPSETTDVLTIATSVSVAQWILAPGLPAFRRANPTIRLRIVTTVWPDEFAASGADVEIRFGAAGMVGKGAVPLGSNQMITVAAPGLLAGRTEWPDIAALPLIQAVGSSDNWPDWCKTQGLPRPLDPALLVDNHGMAVTLAVSGAGVALTSALIAGPALAIGQLIQPITNQAPATDGYFLASRNDNPEIRLFVDWLENYVAGMAT